MMVEEEGAGYRGVAAPSSSYDQAGKPSGLRNPLPPMGRGKLIRLFPAHEADDAA